MIDKHDFNRRGVLRRLLALPAASVAIGLSGCGAPANTPAPAATTLPGASSPTATPAPTTAPTDAPATVPATASSEDTAAVSRETTTPSESRASRKCYPPVRIE